MLRDRSDSREVTDVPEYEPAPWPPHDCKLEAVQEPTSPRDSFGQCDYVTVCGVCGEEL